MFWLFKKKKKDTACSVQKKEEACFNDSVAKEILKSIRDEFGLDYSKQEQITMRKIERFARKNEMMNFETLQRVLRESPLMKEQLVNMLTVGETYFYRETGHFKILADLMQTKSMKKILCAPSSSGEEAYSIIMYLLENQKESLPVSVVGIDVNSDSIAAAQEALYSERSTSLLPNNMRQNYFTQENTHYKLNENVKQYATFLRQNIFDDSLFNLGKFDAIFCRNMLIYFDDKEKKEVLKRLHKMLNPEGVLFLGHADIAFTPEGFEKVLVNGGHYFLCIK